MSHPPRDRPRPAIRAGLTSSAARSQLVAVEFGIRPTAQPVRGSPVFDATFDSITTFGELLRHLRKRVRLTQDEFGLAMGHARACTARLTGSGTADRDLLRSDCCGE